MSEINLEFEKKHFPQTHVSLGELKERFSTKMDFRSPGLHWNPEKELGRKTRQNQFKTQ